MPKRKTSPPVDVGLNQVVIEPYTKIVHFQGIQWAVQLVVMAAIGHLLYGDDKERRGEFYKGKIGRGNKEALLRMASQVYSYIDGTISEFGDIDDYVFRVLTSVTVDKVNGSIMGEPVFEVEIFKHIGRVSAKGVESGHYLEIVYVGKESDTFISPSVIKTLRKAVSEFKFVKLVPYKDPKSSPSSIRAKVKGNHPTLIIEGEPFAVKLKVDKDGSNFIYVQDGENEFAINDEKDMVVFISKKSGWQPEIIGGATAFEPVERAESEIRQISESIMKDVTKTEEVNIIGSLNLDKVIEDVENRLKPAEKSKTADEEIKNKVKETRKKIEDAKEKYSELKIEYEVAIESLRNLDEKFEGQEITPNDYQVARWKTLKTKVKSRDELVKLQRSIKESITAELGVILNDLHLGA